MRYKYLIFLLAGNMFSFAQNSELIIAPLFKDNMVLQQQNSVPIWGWSKPNNSIKIYTSWNDKTKIIKSNSSGKFFTKLETISHGGPFEVKIFTDSESVDLKNVMLGEVWLASGQSNMEWSLSDPILKSFELDSMANMSDVRFFKVPKIISLNPIEQSKGKWSISNSTNAAKFSAVAYFFAKKLNQELDIPIGIIQSVWGGTPVESWMPLDHVEKVKRFANIREEIKEDILNKSKYQKWLEGMQIVDISKKEIKEIDQILHSFSTIYSGVSVNDTHWNKHELPVKFEMEFGEIDPLVWYRKEFYFDGNINNKDYELFLGPIDDLDNTYINGVKIGGELGWQKDRVYKIPEGLLKKGKNIIAISVLDNGGGGGGIYKNTPQIRNQNKIIVSLDGNWKYKMLGCFENKFTFRLFNENFNLENKPILLFSQESPTTLFNTMIAPLIPYSIKGAIWYQGENNVGDPVEYAKSFPLMIEAWRKYWNQGDFPFYYVQIAPYNYGSKKIAKAAMLREAQRLTMRLSNTGMVVTSDIGDINDIHPANKYDVGKRLALWALNNNYEKKDIVYSGPQYKSIVTEGNSIRVNFDNVGSGLFCPDTALTFFEIAGEDGKYYPAVAKIDKEQVVVKSSKVKQPVHLRFGWTDTATPNLFNKEGLPASSFSSDPFFLINYDKN